MKQFEQIAFVVIAFECTKQAQYFYMKQKEYPPPKKKKPNNKKTNKHEQKQNEKKMRLHILQRWHKGKSFRFNIRNVVLKQVPKI